MIPPRIENVVALDDYIVEITYVTNEMKKYDMKAHLNKDFFKRLKNKEYFKLVKSVGPTIEWPHGEDMDPNELYENGKNV